MLHAPPPFCRADALQRYITVRPGPDGVLISMGLYTDRPCRLPTRPGIQLVVDGRRVPVQRTALQLSSEDVPRTTIRPKQPASAFVRWRNWCGVHDPVVMLLTLGGVTVREPFGSANTHGPACISAAKPSTLAVSTFVRR